MSNYLQAVLPVMYKATEQTFRYGMPLVAKVKPLVLAIGVMFGFTRAVMVYALLVYKAGPKNLFTWKTRKLPEIANDPSLGTHSTLKTSDGVKLHMVVKGDGRKPVMLFLHGFPENWYSWRAQMQYFSRDYRCVALSLRGYAESDKPKNVEDYAMAKLINDVKETIEFLGVKNVVLVSHDWGGLIAWAMTMAYPDMVSKLVVCNAPHPKIFPTLMFSELQQFTSSWYVYFFQIPMLPELLIRTGNFLFLDICFGPLLKNNKLSEEEMDIYKFYAANGSLTPMINFYRAYMRGMTKPPSDKSGVIETPTLLLWGMKDLALTQKCLENNEKWVTNLTIVKIEEASHWVQQDAPDAVNSSIASFL
jgi:pimeloyl-ACP methyl ester carboxylesterase